MWPRAVAEGKLALDGSALAKDGKEKVTHLLEFVRALSAGDAESSLDAVKQLEVKAQKCGQNLKVLQKDLKRLDMRDDAKAMEEQLRELEKWAVSHRLLNDIQPFEALMHQLWGNEAAPLQVPFDAIVEGTGAGDELWLARLNLVCA